MLVFSPPSRELDVGLPPWGYGARQAYGLLIRILHRCSLYERAAHAHPEAAATKRENLHHEHRERYD